MINYIAKYRTLKNLSSCVAGVLKVEVPTPKEKIKKIWGVAKLFVKLLLFNF